MTNMKLNQSFQGIDAKKPPTEQCRKHPRSFFRGPLSLWFLINPMKANFQQNAQCRTLESTIQICFKVFTIRPEDIMRNKNGYSPHFLRAHIMV